MKVHQVQSLVVAKVREYLMDRQRNYLTLMSYVEEVPDPRKARGKQ